jgi:hypothetical protein
MIVRPRLRLRSHDEVRIARANEVLQRVDQRLKEIEWLLRDYRGRPLHGKRVKLVMKRIAALINEVDRGLNS